MPCAASGAPLLQRVAVHSGGAVAAAVDSHGGVHVFDLLRHTRARVWQEGPFSGGFCWSRATELLLAVGNKVRVIDIRNHKHLASLIGHKEAVTFAAAENQHALTFSCDRLMLWQISDWSLLRRVAEPGAQDLVAAHLRPQQVGALHRDGASGRLTWSLWSLGDAPQLAADGHVPRVDGVPVMCLTQLACGDGFVSVVVRKKKSKVHEVLLWKVPGASYGCSVTAGAPWRLRMPAPVQQMLAQQRWLFLLCGSQVLRVEVATRQVQHVEWPGLSCLDVSPSGLAVGLVGAQMEFSVKHLAARPRDAVPRRARSASGRGRSRCRPAPGTESASLKTQLCQTTADKTSQLSQFLQRFGGFGRGQRPQCWQQLLELRGEVESCEAAPIEARQSPRQRRNVLVQRLTSLRPEFQNAAEMTTAACSLAVSVFPANEALTLELAERLLSNWLYPMSPDRPSKRRLLLLAERQLRARDLELGIYLEMMVQHLFPEDGATVGTAVLWPMVRGLLQQNLPRSVCMVLWDHLILSWREPWRLLLAAVAVLRSKRHLLLHRPLAETRGAAAAAAMALIQRATETDPVELLKEFQLLSSNSDIDATLWNAEGPEVGAEPATGILVPDAGKEVDVKEDGVERGADKQTQTEQQHSGEAAESDFAQLFASLSFEPQGAHVAQDDNAIELEVEKNEFLRFRAEIHGGDAANLPSTVLPSESLPGLESEIKASLARLNTSLDSTTLDFPEFSDSGLELCT